MAKMQHRTKTHLLTKEEIKEALNLAQVGRIGIVCSDGFPYVLPLHFVYADEKIYLHGLPKGKKIEGIKQNPNVCFEIDQMVSLLKEGVENPCDVNTEFNSVILQGKASLVGDFEEKKSALKRIVEKFTPLLINQEIPDKMIQGTAIIRIDILNSTGRYYR